MPRLNHNAIINHNNRGISARGVSSRGKGVNLPHSTYTVLYIHAAIVMISYIYSNTVK